MKSDPGSIYSREESPSGGPLVSDGVRLTPPIGEMEGRMGAGGGPSPSPMCRGFGESGWGSSGYVQGSGYVVGMEGDRGGWGDDMSQCMRMGDAVCEV
jgi:hypothetical protein